MSLKKEFQKNLKDYQVSPKKYMGQNFLISERIYRKIVEAANLSKKDEVLEVGGGIGYLTNLLAQKAKRVLSVEKDKSLSKILKETTKENKNVKIIEGDIRYFNPLEYGLKKRKYKIVANLPYYLTSFFLRTFLEKYPPKSMVLLVQKEVAERIVAKNKKESLLSLSVKFFSLPKVISLVKKENFWPKPKVDSAILELKIKKKTLVNPKDFFSLLKIGFSSPRKKLIKNLSRKFKREKIEKIFQELNIPSKSRAEDLSLENWISLTKILSSDKIKK